MKSRFIIVACFILIAVVCLFFMQKDNIFAKDNSTYIAHGGGIVDNLIVSNTKEALISNYEKGLRLFELDLYVTANNNIVAYHNDNIGTGIGSSMPEILNLKVPEQNDYQNNKLKTSYFKNNLIDNKYSCMFIEDIIDFLNKYKDAYIIIDNKESYENEKYIFDTFKGKIKNKKILDRIIPQVFDEQSYNNIMSTYKYDNIIFSIYKTSMSEDEMIEFMKINNNIKAISVFYPNVTKNFIDKVHNINRYFYAHTINDEELFLKYKNMGIDGIYTDELY